MRLEFMVQYRDLFDDEMPSVDVLLSKVPSKLIIWMMATINNLIATKGDAVDAQVDIFKCFRQVFPEDRLWQRGIGLIRGGRIMFAMPFTMELMSVALLNYVDHENEYLAIPNTVFFYAFQAYLITMTECCQRDSDILRSSSQKNETNTDSILSLVWPHLISQLEFQERVNPFIEFQKTAALLAFMENHERLGRYMVSLYRSMNCDSRHEYLNRFAGLLVNKIENEGVDQLEFLSPIRIDEPDTISSFVIDPLLLKSDPDLTINHKALKEKPIFRLSSNMYIILNYDYLYASFYNQILSNFCKYSGIVERYSDETKIFRRVKGIIGKEFSEEIMFKSIMQKCFKKKYTTLLFEPSQQVNVDCYYRCGNHLFLIEFKDRLVDPTIIRSGCFEAIKTEVDKKFVSYTDDKGIDRPCGIGQIFRSLNYLTAEGEFWEIDEKAKLRKLKLRNMIIYPIIVQTNIHFDLPGINFYLDKLFKNKCFPILDHVKQIAPLTMINLEYFLERFLLFADGKIHLKDEVKYYHHVISKHMKKWKKFGRLDNRLNSITSFTSVTLPSEDKLGYRRQEWFDNFESLFYNE